MNAGNQGATEMSTNYRGEAVNTESIEQMGYTVSVEKCNGPSEVAYFLTGKRGAVYGMIRNQSNPEMIFPVSSKGKVVRIKGYEWFSDKNGKLQPVNAR